MNTARKFLLLIWLTGGVLLLGSCKKDHDTTPEMAGNWIGQYGFGQQAAGVGYKFFIQENGELGVSQDTTSTTPGASGTWHLSGNTFRATYAYKYGLTYTVEGTLNNRTISGTWGEANQSTLGQFTVTKK